MQSKAKTSLIEPASSSDLNDREGIDATPRVDKG